MVDIFTDVIQNKGGNRAISVNPPHDLDFHITKRGSDWLWAVFACFGLLMVVYIFLFFIAELKGSRITRYAIAPAFLIAMFEFSATSHTLLTWVGLVYKQNSTTLLSTLQSLVWYQV